MSTTSKLNVTRKAGRFEIHRDGSLLGHAEFHDRPGVRDFTYTFVDGAERGRGVAAELIREALEQTQSENLAVRPSCNYVADFIDQHEEFRDMLEAPQGNDFNVPG